MFIILLFTYFHPGWLDFDSDKLNTRQEVLIRDSIVEPTIKCTKSNCAVTSGLWLCPYTNKLYTNPKLLDIDHVVPIKEAYRSGAKHWSKEKFIRFANDPENLLVVDAKANRSKGDKEPSVWPKFKDSLYWCEDYVRLYLQIKAKYNLDIDYKDSCSTIN